MKTIIAVFLGVSLFAAPAGNTGEAWVEVFNVWKERHVRPRLSTLYVQERDRVKALSAELEAWERVKALSAELEAWERVKAGWPAYAAEVDAFYRKEINRGRP